MCSKFVEGPERSFSGTESPQVTSHCKGGFMVDDFSLILHLFVQLPQSLCCPASCINTN